MFDLERIAAYAELIHPVEAVSFGRPIVVIQSDDWGWAGIRDRAAVEAIERSGLSLGAHPFDRYSLERAEDVAALSAMLLGHRDRFGNPPSMTCNFVVSNVDFERSRDRGAPLSYHPLSRGLPAPWSDGAELVGAYREAIESGALNAGLHGVTHFCRRSVEQILEQGGPRSDVLRLLFSFGVPLIYGHTPWVGFELKDAAFDGRWLKLEDQGAIALEGRALFREVFGSEPSTACAPGYRANRSTYAAWASIGIDVAQCGPGSSQAAYFGRRGLLHLHRNVELEPATHPHEDVLENAVRAACRAVARKEAIVLSTHSINFQSRLFDHRTQTLSMLDRLLDRLEHIFPELVYLDERGVLELAQRGSTERFGRRITAPVERRWLPHPALISSVRAKIDDHLSAI